MFFKGLVLAVCLVGVLSDAPLPLTKYGLPLEDRTLLTKYDFKLPDTPVTSFTPHEVYGVPKVYEAPKYKTTPVVTKYDFTIKEEPKLAPYPAAVKIIKPAEVYGVPEIKTYPAPVAPVVTKYDYTIKEQPIVKLAPYPAEKPHEVYGLPVEKPQEVYGVPAAPVVTKYDYTIKELPKLAPYPAKYDYKPYAPKIDYKPYPAKYDYKPYPAKYDYKPYPAKYDYKPYPAPVAPVVTKYDFTIKEEPKLAPYPAVKYEKPHEIYGPPAVTKYDYAIKELPKLAPYPAQVYGPPLLKTPVVTKYDYTIKELPKPYPPQVPHEIYGPPKPYPAPVQEVKVIKPQLVYGVPEYKKVTPVVTKYDYTIKEEPKVLKTYSAPYPKPHEVYGVPV